MAGVLKSEASVGSMRTRFRPWACARFVRTHRQYIHNSMRYLLLFTSLIVFLMGPSLQAQKKGGSVEFSCVIWKNLSHSQIYYRQEKEYVPLELSPGNRSKLYTLKGSSLELYILVESEEEEGVVYQLVGKSTIPAGMSCMLFFITERNEAGKLPLILSGIDDSLLTFPRGTCRFVNLTKNPLLVSFGGGEHMIKPKQMTVVKSKVSKKGGLLPFVVWDRSGKLYENRYNAHQIGRDMIFILPATRPGGRVLVKMLPQLVAYTPTPEAKPADEDNN